MLLAAPKSCRWTTALLAFAIGALCPLTAQAAINWDGEGVANWWFDPDNWSQDAANQGLANLLPPAQDNEDGTVRFTDAQVNIGTAVGEGVVYDPDNDPFFAAATGLQYPTGSPLQPLIGTDYGPEHLYRLYVSRNTTAENLITIKSGDLAIASTTIIGRSGSTAVDQNSGRINQTGGTVRLPVVSLDIGNSEASGWGNGTYAYYGGTLEVSLDAGAGIRLAHGRGVTGPSGVNRFIIGNGEAGHIRTWDYNTISYRGSENGQFDDPATDFNPDPNGVDRGVAYTEFLYENGGTRPVQVARNVILNNGVEADTGAMLSSRLVLTLDEAPAVDGGGVPIDLGLFDVNFDIGFGDNGGIVDGFGDIDNDGLEDAVFASEDGATHYLEGDTVSALFGGTRYDWTISYTGDITWTDEDNSIVNTISGAGSGGDIVLIGLGSEVVGPGLMADFNGDGAVDLLDLDILGSNFGMPGDGSTGDANGDGTVDLLDLDILGSEFGMSAANGTAIPEPAAALLALVAATSFGLRRRSH